MRGYLRTCALLAARQSLFLTGLLGLSASHAQVATNYVFSSSAGSFSSISGGTQLWGGFLQLDNIDDNVSGAQTIPPFNFGGTIYTQMYVSSNGFITFGSAPATNNYTPISSSAGYAGAIAAFGTDLQNTNASFGFAQREVRWEQVGNEVVVQWKGLRRKGVSNENFNMQLRLNTSTSVIRAVYGSLSGQGSSTGFQPEVGLRGPNNTFGTNVNNRLVGTGAENWSSSLAGTANNSTMRFTTGAPAKAFTNGLTYTWTPNCSQPTATTTIVPNCSNNTYTVQVNVTGLGGAPNVDLVSSVGGLFADNVGTGTYTSPAVSVGTPVTITVVHNANGICSIPLGPFNPIIACSGTCLATSLVIPADGCSTNNNLDVLVPASYPGTALGVDVLLQSVDLIVAADLLNNSDLQIRLISPGGQSRNMVLGRFGNGTNLGNPANCPTAALRLIDGGAALTNSSINNVTGNYQPEQTLAGYTGNPNGTWTLRLCDNGIILSGALKYVKLNFVTRGSQDPCAPTPITCGASLVTNSTAGYPNTLPATACNFNGAASTGGTHWWTCTAASAGEMTASLCGQSTFNSRISVFLPQPSCTAPTCIAMSDDAPGCPSNSSEVRFMATAGQQYLIAVHGSGAATGSYTMSLFCQAACTPGVSNDACSTALAMTSVLADGSGSLLDQDNTCAHVDDPTSLSGASHVVGLWYAFNSGPNAHHRLHALKNSDNAIYSASVLNYALYSGSCTNMGATGPVITVGNAPSAGDLPTLAPNTDYKLLVYNNGALSQNGSYAIMLDHPGLDDAGVTAVTSPNGLVCGGMFAPVVTLKNFGEHTLTAVTLRVTIDGGGSVLDYPWTGSLAYNTSTNVTLPSVATPAGVHSVQVTVLQPNGANDGIASNDAASSTYDASGNACKVTIHTDGAGSETTWVIYDAFAFPLASGGPYANNTTIETEVCLPTTFGDSYSFFLFDSGGDGMCCGNGNGFWELHDMQGRTLLRDQFMDGAQSPPVDPQTPAYSQGHSFSLPAGPTDIMANECGVFTNDLQSKVYCMSVANVSLYQFEFSDPDAGFLRRIAVPRPWVKFGEMTTSPLLPGTVYFTRVRVDQGAPGFSDDRFGGGCEMGINPVTVPGCTQLIDNPALPTHSCGVTKTFGGSDKIWAQPVVNGTLYKFNFVNAGLGYNRTIQSNNYVCILNWVTQPLVSGNTYQVKVNVLVNGQWSGFCGSACDVTIMDQFAGGEERSLEVQEDGIEAMVYPNPTRDGRVNVHLDGLLEHEGEITIEVYSLKGERMAADRFSHDGPVFDRVVTLRTDLESGVYLMRITAGDRVITSRLSVVR